MAGTADGATMTCPKCAASTSSDAARFCPQCGWALGARALDWRWIVFGAAIMTVAQMVVLVVARRWASLAESEWDVLLALVGAVTSGDRRALFVVGLPLAGGYLAGGVLVGRMSAGHTILEPALAAVAPLALALVRLLVRARMAPDRAALIGAAALLIGGFAAALAGGWLGERWQGLSRAKQGG